MKRKILFHILCALLLSSCNKQKKIKVPEQTKKELTKIDSLDRILDSIQQTNVLPGFAVSIFSADKIIYQKGFGFSNLAEKTPFQIDNIQIIASVTKTLVGISLMKAVEEGLLNLDDAINDILPYKVINPNFSQEKITVRMLAAHTSSIAGTKDSDKGYRFKSPLLASEFPEAYQPLLENYNKTDVLSMATFLQKKLDQKGEWYQQKIFTKEKPGTAYEYSNLGIALLAQIIEIKTQQTFAEYTKNLILKPLGMNASYWELNNVPVSMHTTYYNELKNEVPPYYIITYPDGGLYSSIADMTTYLQEMIKGYDGKSKLLSKTSFREMMKKQFEGENLPDGICWDLSYDGLVGHSGNDFGTATLMYFSPQTGIGRILFTNISIETEAQETAFYGVFNTLFAYDF